MTKKILTAIFTLFLLSNAYGQKELWGYRGGNNGAIIKIPLNATTPVPEDVHAFDVTGMQGKLPVGRLFQASNGKLYGITGFRSTEGEPGAPRGVLFEYDLILGQYTVLSTTLINVQDGNLGGLIEPVPGMLYGTTNGGNAIFRHNIATGVTAIVATVPSFMYNGNNNFPRIMGELMKASDGNVYFATDMAPLSNIPFPGGIYKLNLTTNQVTKLYVFGANPEDGYVIHPEFDTRLVEGAPGKLYGTAKGGTHFGPQGVAPLGSGTLYEFTIATNTVVKKYDFDYNTIGMGASPIIKSGNKLYGSLFGQGDSTFPNSGGLLYAYDLVTESLSVTRIFSQAADGIQHPVGLVLNASDGNFYGSTNLGNYRFNPVTDDIQPIANGTFLEAKDFIEICRKPSYAAFSVSAFTVCAGSPFTLNLHNGNATSYVWKKGNVVLPAQTSSILNIAAVAVADSGVYTCEMTNECGTTVTPPITLTVNPSNASTVTSAIPTTGGTIMICPGTTVTLSGNNNGGTWSTGATTPTITVSQAGSYQITNTNSCGNTYSNIVNVGLYETLAPITISYENFGSLLCLGAPITFTGNVGGVWEDGSTGSTYTTIVDTTTAHFVTRTNECGTVTSNIIQFTNANLYGLPLTPQIIPDGPTSICAGSSLVLNSNGALNDIGSWAWYTINPLSYVGFGNSITVTQPGTYILVRNTFCYGDETSEPITVTVSTEVPAVPVITIDGSEPLNVISICDGQSVTFESNADQNLWSTGETTPTINVTTTGLYNVSAVNGCGTAASGYIYVNVLPSPNNAVSQTGNVLYSNDANATYQWMVCGEAGAELIPIPGATGQGFTATEPGSYAVVATNADGCESTSDCYTVTNEDLGINTHDFQTILLYPNPATDTVVLRTNLDIEAITVINILGQVVLESESTNVVNVSKLPAGHYILMAQTDIGIWRTRFIKQ